MAVKSIKKKEGNIDINIRVENLERLIKEGRRRYHKRENWKHQGIGFWGFGSALAMILSYTQNSSILWAIIHGIISWFYVIYRIIILYL